MARAALVAAGAPGSDSLAAPLIALAGPDFQICTIIGVTPHRVRSIIAPSYKLLPDRTKTEQIASAMTRHGVGRL